MLEAVSRENAELQSQLDEKARLVMGVQSQADVPIFVHTIHELTTAHIL